MFEKPFGAGEQKFKVTGFFFCLSVSLLFAGVVAILPTGSVSAAELRILDTKGDAYVVFDALSGSTFSVEAVTTLESDGSLTLKGGNNSFSTSKEITRNGSSSGVVFEGVEAGTYTLVPSDEKTTVTKVDILSSSQVLGRGAENGSSAAASDSSGISKSAYSAGAAAVAGAVAVGASAGASSIISSGSGSSAAGAARFGGGAFGGAGVSNPFIVINPRSGGAPSFDPDRPGSVPVAGAPDNIPAPAAAPTPRPTEFPASNPSGQPSVMPAPPIKDPMTPS